jgi:hypothetical protein
MIMVDEMPSPQGFPQALGDIVVRNRDLFELGFATAAELAAVTGDVDAIGVPRGRIDHWRVIALRDRVIGHVTLHVLGRFGDARAWMTSAVAVLASNTSRVRTKNSVYVLGQPATGEPDLSLLLHVAFTLRWWGLDRRYDLGVVPVAYD